MTNIKDVNFDAWVSGLDDTEKSAMTAGDALAKYQTHLDNAGKSTSKFGDKFKSFGKSALSIGANIVAIAGIELAISLAVKAWDAYSNSQENAIQKGNTTLSEYKSKLDGFQQVKSKLFDQENVSDSTAARFVELGKGVGSLGENVSLTTDQFSEYNSIANEIASTLPELVSGYSSLGTPIIDAATSIDSLNTALEKQKSLLNKENIGNAQDYIKKFNAENNQQKTDITKEAGTQQQLERIQKIVDAYNRDGTVKDVISKKYGISDALIALIPGASGMTGENPQKIIDDNTLKQIAKDLDIDITTWLGDIDENKVNANIDKFAAYSNALQAKAEASVEGAKPLIQSYIEETPDYSKLSNETKTAMSKMLSDMDYENASQLFFNESGKLDSSMIEKWSNDLTFGLKKSGVQNNLKELFSLNNVADDMSFSEYEKKVNSLSESLGKNVEGISAEQFKSMSGATAKLKDLQAVKKQILDDNKITTSKDLDKYSNSDLQLVLDIVANDNATLTIDQIDKKLKELKETSDEISNTKYFDSWQAAAETPNQGSKYDSISSGLASAKELRDKGIVGTDDFKSFAALISPTGSDDMANFDENYGKYKRYFTDNPKDGLKKLAKDLSTVTDGVGDAGQKLAEFNEETGQWDFNITDVDAAAQKLGISSEVLTAAFGKMNEYNGEFGSNNIVGSLNDGLSRSSELTSNLVDEQTRYNKLITESDADKQGYSTSAGSHTFGNQTAIDASAEKLKQYRVDIKETMDNTDALIAKSGKSDELKRKSAIEATKALSGQKKAADEAGMTDLSSDIQAQMDKFGQDYKFDVEAEVNFDMNNSVENVQGLISQITVIATAGGGLMDTSRQMNTLAEQIQQIADHDGDVSALVDQFNMLAMVSKNDTRLDGDGDPFSLKEATINAESLGEQIKQLPHGSEEAKNAFQNMGASINKIADAGGDISGLVEKFNELAASSGSDYRMELTGQIVDVDEYTGESPLITVNAEADFNELQQQIGNATAGQTINFTGNINGLETTINAVKNADGTITYTATVGGVEQVLAPVLSAEGEISFQVAESPDTVNDAQGNANFILGTYPTAVPDASGKVNLSLGSYPMSVPSITQTVNQRLGMPIFGGAVVNGTKTTKRSLANSLSPIPTLSARAYALGSLNITGYGETKTDEMALTGELGREMVVYGNRWWTVGDNGAEFSSIPAGSIVFDTKKTDELLSKGFTNGRGIAHNMGTSVNSGKAYASGTSDNTDNFDKIDILLSRQEHIYDRLGTALENCTSSFEEQSKLIDKQVSYGKDRLSTLQEASAYYTDKANSSDLSEGYKNQVRYGQMDISTIADEDLKKKIDDYQKWHEKALDLEKTIDSLNQELRELENKKLDNIQNDFEKGFDYHDVLKDINDAKIKFAETVGEKPDEILYTNNISQYSAQRSYLNGELLKMQSEFNKQASNGALVSGSDEYYEYKNKINELRVSIIECNTNIADMQNELLELRWTVFDDAINKLEHMADLTSALNHLIDDTMAFATDTSSLSGLGYAKIGLYMSDMITAKQGIADYSQAMKDLNEQYKKGLYSQSEYKEKLVDLQKSQLDYANNLKETKDNILGLIKEGINKETEAMQKLTNARKNALSRQKEADDYEKNIRNKNKDISSIEAKIAGLEGNTSKQAIAERKKLQDELSGLKDDLSETQKDHEQDMIEQAYDDQMEKFQETQDKQSELLDSSIEAQNKALDALLASTSENYNKVYDELTNLAKEYGIDLDSSISNPWTNAINAIKAYKDAMGGLDSDSGVNTGDISTGDIGITGGNKGWNTGSDGKKYYVDENGAMIDGFQTIDGKQNYFGEGANNYGALQTGAFTTLNGDRYFADSNGAIKTNSWNKDSDGTWYHTDESGKLQTGWFIDSDKKWYHMDSTGAMAKDQWQFYKDQWYYMDSTGAMMKDQWKFYKDKWYYMNTDGVMDTNKWVGDYYLNNDGTMATSRWIGNKYVQENGAIARDAYVKYRDHYCWVDKDGVWESQWDTKTPDLKKYKLAYKNGTKNAGHGIGLYDEEGLGSEAIMTKSGLLTEFQGGEMVFNRAMKSNLWDFAVDPSMYMKDLVKPFDYSSLAVDNSKGGDIILDCSDMIHIDKLTGADLEDVDKFANEITKRVTRTLADDFGKRGVKMRY